MTLSQMQETTGILVGMVEIKFWKYQVWNSCYASKAKLLDKRLGIRNRSGARFGQEIDIWTSQVK